MSLMRSAVPLIPGNSRSRLDGRVFSLVVVERCNRLAWPGSSCNMMFACVEVHFVSCGYVVASRRVLLLPCDRSRCMEPPVMHVAQLTCFLWCGADYMSVMAPCSSCACVEIGLSVNKNAGRALFSCSSTLSPLPSLSSWSSSFAISPVLS